MRDPKLQLKKEQLIKQEFLRHKKENKYTSSYIIEELLMPRFFLAARTIEDIVYGKYDRQRERRQQLS